MVSLKADTKRFHEGLVRAKRALESLDKVAVAAGVSTEELGALLTVMKNETRGHGGKRKRGLRNPYDGRRCD